MAVTEAGRELGIEGLDLGEARACDVDCGNGLMLELLADQDAGRLLLSATLGALPQDRREELIALLLDANFFWHGTGGATAALAADDGIVLQRSLPADTSLDGETLAAILELFLTAAAQIREVAAADIPNPANQHSVRNEFERSTKS